MCCDTDINKYEDGSLPSDFYTSHPGTSDCSVNSMFLDQKVILAILKLVLVEEEKVILK